MAVDAGHPAGFEGQLPQPQLIARHVRSQIDGTHDLRIHSLAVGRGALLADCRPDSDACDQREQPGHEPQRTSSAHNSLRRMGEWNWWEERSTSCDAQGRSEESVGETGLER